MSVSTDWLPVQSTLTPPSVDCELCVYVGLAYLGETCVDISAVLAAVKRAVSEAVGAAAGSLSINTLAVAVLAVPGIEGVRSATINGDVVDVTAASFSTRPEYVDLTDARIVVS